MNEQDAGGTTEAYFEALCREMEVETDVPAAAAWPQLRFSNAA